MGRNKSTYGIYKTKQERQESKIRSNVVSKRRAEATTADVKSTYASRTGMPNRGLHKKPLYDSPIETLSVEEYRRRQAEEAIQSFPTRHL